MSAVHYSRDGVALSCGKTLSPATSWTKQPESVTCIRCAKNVDVIGARSSPALQRISHSLRQQIDDGTLTDEQIDRASSSLSIFLEIDAEHARALAQFCERATFETFAQCATGKAEAYMMRDSLNVVRSALRAQGFEPDSGEKQS